MGFAEKRGEGKDTYWRGRFKLPGKTKSGKAKYGTLPDKYKTGKAAKKAADIEEAKALDPKGGYTDPRKALTPFGEWALSCMEHKVKDGRTMEHRWFLLEKLLLPRWEFEPIGSITWFDIESWADRSPYDDDSTVRQAITLMSQILTWAVDAAMLTTNVARGRRRSPNADDTKPKPVKRGGKNKIFPTAEQAILISRRCDSEAERLMIIVATWAGLRYGELCALHRDNCLLERIDRIDGRAVVRHVIRIDPDVGELKEYGERVSRGKTKAVVRLGSPKPPHGAREIDVPPFLVELLRDHMKQWPHPYLFTTQSGTFWRRPNWSQRVMRPICDGTAAAPNAPWIALSSRLVERIRAEEGEYAPGGRLPTISTLSTQEGVSASTVQRAIAHLAVLGIVIRHPGRRASIADDACTRLPPPDLGGATEAILPGLGLHGCRHAHKTVMEQGDEYGEIPKVLQNEAMGHAYRGIDGVYIHPTPQMRQRRLRLLEKWWWDAQRVLSGETVEGSSPPADTNSPEILPKFSHRVVIRNGRTRRARSATQA